MKFLHSKFIVFVLSLILFFINYLIFYPILNSKSLIFPYALHPFDIVKNYPIAWKNLKVLYCVSSYFSIYATLNSFLLFKSKKPTIKKSKVSQNNLSLENSLNLFVGHNSFTNEKIYITEKALYQNILVTGTIGSREN